MPHDSSRRDFLVKGLGGLTALAFGLGDRTAQAADLRAARRALGQGRGRRGGNREVPYQPSEFEGPLLEKDLGAFVFSRVKYTGLNDVPDQWDAHPIGDQNLIAYAQRAINVKFSSLSWGKRVVDLGNVERVYTLPFLFMTGESDFRLPDNEAAVLGEFIKRGGFLYADDCGYNLVPRGQPAGDFFYQGFLREIQRAVPGCRMEKVPPDHPIYHCFYDLPGKAPWNQGHHDDDMGLFYQDRLAVFLTSGDVHCAWAGYLLPNREASFRMGVNIIIHALTH